MALVHVSVAASHATQPACTIPATFSNVTYSCVFPPTHPWVCLLWKCLFLSQTHLSHQLSGIQAIVDRSKQTLNLVFQHFGILWIKLQLLHEARKRTVKHRPALAAVFIVMLCIFSHFIWSHRPLFVVLPRGETRVPLRLAQRALCDNRQLSVTLSHAGADKNSEKSPWFGELWNRDANCVTLCKRDRFFHIESFLLKNKYSLILCIIKK